ncbi:hypothetical protein B0D71_04715 [Pseudomonas laurylsulfativorans]|uniref:Uncharacterized protein n=1 Tax=Pseudomonas laurylsulfativorans TaxID=1943631 RepID=A0A2S3VVY3_9PSED|nr:hypothetical protein B0D71_04715 [Pseudomonas laurylsulfativorans]
MGSLVTASLLAMVVNDNAGCLVPSGGLGSIASRLAPTGGEALFFWAFTGLDATRSLVRAGLSGRRIAAMVVNDNAREPDKRGALASIAGRPAPTVSRECVNNLIFGLSCYPSSES